MWRWTENTYVSPLTRPVIIKYNYKNVSEEGVPKGENDKMWHLSLMFFQEKMNLST